MLAQRIVTRFAITIRQGSQLQRRFIHPSRSQLQTPQPNTWLAKLRFRPDGTPRSKLIAFGFGSLILCNCLTLLYHRFYIKQGEQVRKMMTRMILVQQTDATYDSVDFGDPMSIMTYFEKILQVTTGLSEEKVHSYILVVRAIYMETKDDSMRIPGLKALSIMKSTADKIHGALQGLGPDEDPSAVMFFVQLTVNEAVRSLTPEVPK